MTEEIIWNILMSAIVVMVFFLFLVRITKPVEDEVHSREFENVRNWFTVGFIIGGVAAIFSIFGLIWI